MKRHAREVDDSEDYDNPSEAQNKLAEKYEFSWPGGYPLYWGDEMLSGDEPSVAVSEETMVLYHNYCGGLEDTLGRYLKARGATLESEVSQAPTVAIFLDVPAGNAGKKVTSELEAFFGQAQTVANLSDWKAAPWKPNNDLPYSKAEEASWFCDGEMAAFNLPMDTGDLDQLKAYLKRRKVSNYRVFLCDHEIAEKLQSLRLATRCPECRQEDLKYLAAEQEGLDEDQLLCRDCGGMFTLTAIESTSPVSRIGDDTLNNIVCIEDRTYVSGRDGSIYRRLGGEFKRVKNHAGQLFGLYAVSAKILIASGYGGVILRSTNGGSRWTQIDCDVKGYLFTISSAPGGALFIAGEGAILRSLDQGQSWKRTKVPVKGYMLHIGAVDDDLMFAAGHGGVILRSTNGGAAWRKLTSGVSTPLCRIMAFDEQRVVTVGDRGVVLTTEDGGKTWTKRSTGNVSDIEDLVMGNDGRLYAVTSTGQILISADLGKKWTGVPCGSSSHMWSLCPSSSGVIMLVGENGTLVRREDLDLPAAEGAMARAETVGRSFAVTGKLGRLSRAQVKLRVEMLGGVNKGSVTKDLDYLVVGDEGSPLFGHGDKGSKIIAAEKLIEQGASLQIISESDLARLRRRGPATVDNESVKKAAKKTTKKAAKKTTTKKAAKKAAKKTTTKKAGASATVGKAFLFTGKLSGLTRAKAKKRVEVLGGVSKSSVTKDLDYLVVGDDGSPLFGQGKKGSKIIAAEKLVASGSGLQIISETEFLTLVRSA